MRRSELAFSPPQRDHCSIPMYEHSRDAFEALRREVLAGAPFFARLVRTEDFDRSTVPPPRTMIVEAPAQHPKWAYFRCPCGCGALRSVNLMRTHRPFWEIGVERGALVSLYPSIWVDGQCESHFWVIRS